MKLVPVRVVGQIESQTKLIEICEGYLNNKWFVANRYGDGVDLPFDEIWKFDGFDRSWSFHHHSLVSVSYLVDGFIRNGDQRYLDYSKKIILDWYEVNYPESLSDMGWHDHATAWRLINISRFFAEWRETTSFNQDDFLKLNEIVQTHCEKLADPDFYRLKHNHGQEQDIALFTGAVLFDSMSLAEQWQTLALGRFQKQLDHLYAEDGSYLEHSPQYVYILLKNLYSFLDFIYQINYERAEFIAEKLEKAFKFLIYVIQPDGVFPPIGDSEASTVEPSVFKNWRINSSNLPNFMEQLLTNAPDLTEYEDILPLDEVFKDSGFAQVRNKWTFDQETTQIIMNSGFHSRIHKHHDDLSFVLFNKGIPLITEGGKFNYVYQSVERQYVVSPYAHNSVMVDEKPSEIANKNIEKSGLLSNLLTKNISYVSGTHALYPDVNHRRIFVYFKPSILIVIDKLDGIGNHTFDTFFNLHWELECRQENEAFYGYLNNEKVIGIDNIFSSHENVESIVNRGEMNPLKGWVSPKYGEIVPNSLIQYRTKGRTARNVYQISLDRSLKQGEKVEVSWEGNLVQLVWKSYKVEINLTDFYEHIFIKDKYYRTDKIVKPELFQAITRNESKQFELLRNSRKQ